MVVFKNANYENFLLETKGKRIICYGAGGTLRDFLKNNSAHFSVLNRIDYILDNDKSKSGSTVAVSLKNIPIMTIEKMTALGADISDYVIILCLADRFVPEALRILDGTHIFDGVVCYYGLSAIIWRREIYPPIKSPLPILESKYTIPKIIHYCWFGKNPMSKMELRCIESWKKCCPDYEIKLWNENNYDISNAPLYVKEAYEAKKYAFVSDYTRLDVIFQHGGVYLDTDVELFGNIDYLLRYKSFFAFESLNLINTGLGFASIPLNPVIKDLLSIYNKTSFLLDEGLINTTSCPEYHTEYFRELGISINNSTQCLDDMLFLSSDYFCPLNQRNMKYEFTKNTVANHIFNLSWFENAERDKWISALEESEAINSRLERDWQRGFSLMSDDYIGR